MIGYEKDAGSRTTIRLIYPEAAPHSANEYKHTSMVAVVVFKSLDLDWLASVVTKQPLVSLYITGTIAHTEIGYYISNEFHNSCSKTSESLH